jgi:hypothetical protein
MAEYRGEFGGAHHRGQDMMQPFLVFLHYYCLLCSYEEEKCRNERANAKNKEDQMKKTGKDRTVTRTHAGRSTSRYFTQRDTQSFELDHFVVVSSQEHNRVSPPPP